MAPTDPPKQQASGDEGPAATATPSTNGHNNGSSSSSRGSSDSPSPAQSASWVGNNMAQALRDLARGEQTATALEANLTSLESRLDELLASLGIPPEALDEEPATQNQQVNGDGKKKDT